MQIFVHLIISALAVIITSLVLPGVTLSGFIPAILVALVLGLVNTFIKPFILLITLPLNVLTLGLLTFVINALMILLVSAIVPGFKVRGFWWALIFSLVLSLVNYLLERYFNI